jgi:hypothetical protein
MNTYNRWYQSTLGSLEAGGGVGLSTIDLTEGMPGDRDDRIESAGAGPAAYAAWMAVAA